MAAHPNVDAEVPSPRGEVNPPAHVSMALQSAAIGLWIVVGSLLAYGISQTVIKASALFTG